MRNISAASLAKISGDSNIEPAIIVNVWWTNTTFVSYSDKKYSQNGLVGKLIEISGIEDVVDINASSSSVNLSVTLDDSDGAIKNIFDHNDIHKCFVQVLQWFADLPISEAFILFEGELSSPIIWSEGDRTLKFDVVSMLEDQEVGFSADEARFSYMPSGLVGKAWPIVFGSVQSLEPLAINESPSAIIAQGFGIVNDAAWAAEFENLQDSIEKANINAELAWKMAEGTAIIAGHHKAGTGGFPKDPEKALQLDTQASQLFAQSANYTNEAVKLRFELQSKSAEYAFDKTLEFRTLPITQNNIPSGTSFTAEIGNYTCTALIIGNAVIISNLVEKKDVNGEVGTSAYDFNAGNGTINEFRRDDSRKSQKFVWIEGGTALRLYEYPVQYIATLGHATILNVYATSKYGKALVPSNYYQVSYSTFQPQSGDLVNYQALKVTYITIPIPLATLDPDYWVDGSIEIDVSSNDPGTNVVDIMIWAITNFSGLGYDTTSFNYVKNKVANFPANFVLTERKNVMTFLKEVAFQARCAIWINNRIFYLQYLPEDLDPIEDITDDDAELNSVVITSTETERLVTKFTANWKSRYSQSEPNQVILRYNVKNYGAVEEEYDFYIYNNYAAVAAAAQFWMIRKSNTFKILQCKVALNKLKIEAFDYVNITFSENLVANGTIKGQVTKSIFNPDDDSLTLEIWLPVRFGEMTRYSFAYPGTTQAVYPPLDDVNVQTGNPYADAFVPINPNLYLPTYEGITYSFRNPATWGTGEEANAAPVGGSIITALPTGEVSKARPENIEKKNNSSKREVLPITQIAQDNTISNSYYGEVVEKKNGDTYSCIVYKNGLDGAGDVIDVRIAKMSSESELDPKTPLAVFLTTWREYSDATTFVVKSEYWAQPPVWLPRSSGNST